MFGRIAILMMAGLVTASGSRACECPTPAPGSMVLWAEQIFAVHIESGRHRHRARVLAVWRGVLPETVSISSAPVCGYGFEVGKSYLVYAMDGWESEGIHLCSGSREFDYAYHDRYVLGEPQVQYEPVDVVTMETFIERLNVHVSDYRGDHFYIAKTLGDLKIDPPVVLPRLELIALDDSPDRRLGAITAIEEYGRYARSSYPTLKKIFDGVDTSPALRSAALSAMCRVTGEFGRVQGDVFRSLRDADPVLRIAGLRALFHFEDRFIGMYSGTMRRERLRCLSDSNAAVRFEAVRASRFRSDDDAIGDRIEKLSTTDSDYEVRREAEMWVADRKDNFPFRPAPKRSHDPRTRATVR